MDQSKEILELCKKNNSKLFINYFRRVLPGNKKILTMIKGKKIKIPFQGVCIYSSGLFNSGSHFINLLEFFFGKVIKIKIINKYKKKNEEDFNSDFQLEFLNGKISFLSNKNSSIFINTIDLIMNNGKLTFVNGGSDVLWQPIIKDKRFSNYKILGNTSKIYNNDFDRIQYYVAEQIHLAINGKETLLCTGNDAFSTQKTLEEIKD